MAQGTYGGSSDQQQGTGGTTGGDYGSSDTGTGTGQGYGSSDTGTGTGQGYGSSDQQVTAGASLSTLLCMFRYSNQLEADILTTRI